MKVKSWSIVIGGCLSVVLALSVFKYNQIQAAIAFGNSFPEPMESVELAIAKQVNWQKTVMATGEVVAKSSVDLSNELAGRIGKVGFEPGAQVSKGQLLLSFDIAEELAQRDAATANATIARLLLERNTALSKTGVASLEALDNATAQFNAASAKVAALDATIAKKTLLAPFDANTGLHELKQGQYLAAGTIITRLVGIESKLWIDFNLPQQQASLAVGDSVSMVGYPESEAIVIARDSWVDSQSRNVRYRAEANAHRGLLPGAFVRVSAKLGEISRLIEVPASAIRYDAMGANVYVLNPSEEGADAPERASRRAVELGSENDQKVLVLSGLKVGERVAANGSFKLRENILVNAVVIDAVLEATASLME